MQTKNKSTNNIFFALFSILNRKLHALFIFILLLYSFTFSYKTLAQETHYKEIDQLIDSINIASANQPKKAMVYIRDLQHIAQNYDDSTKASINIFIASFYFQQGLVDLSAEYYFNALDWASKNNERDKETEIYCQLTHLFNSLGESKNAQKYADLALNIAEKTKKNKRLAMAYKAKAGVATIKENYIEAEKYFKLTLQQHLRDQNKIESAKAYNNLAYTNLKLEDYFQALSFLEKALQFAPENQVPILRANILINFASYYIETSGNYTKAIQYLTKARKISEKANQIITLKEIYSLLSISYAKKNNFKKAYHYHVLNEKVNHKINDNEKGQIIFRLQTEFEIEQRKRENKLLEKENELKQLEINRSKIQIWIFSGVSLIMIFIIWSFFNRYTIKKRSNKLLELKNQEIKQINAKLKELNENLEKQIHIKTHRLTISGEREQKTRQQLEILLSFGSSMIFSAQLINGWEIDYFSPNIERELGFMPHEVVRNKDFWYKQIHPHDQKAFFLSMSNIVKQESNSLEFRIKDTKGRYRWLLNNQRIIKNDKGETLAIIGALSNVSELKAIEMKLLKKTENQQKLNQQLNLVNLKLKGSENRFKQLIKLLPEVVLEFSIDGEILFFSEQMHVTFGYNWNDLRTNITFFDLFENNGEDLKKELAHSSKTKQRLKYTNYLAQKKDGKLFPVNIYINNVKHYDEQHVLLAILVDMTDTHTAQLALQKSEERYRDLYENANDLLFAMDRNGILTDFNQTVVKELGYSSEELANISYKEVVLPDYFNTIKQIFDTKDTCFELQIYKKNKEIIWLDIKSKIIYNSDNIAIAIESTARDITEKKLAEQNLKKFEMAVEQNANSIFITNSAGTIEYVNAHLISHLGYKKEEFLGKNINDFDSKYQAMQATEIWGKIAKGKVWKGTIRTKHKDGTLFWESTTISPLINKHNIISNFIGIRQDITHQIEIDEQLKQSQKLQAIGTLAGGISHDFNNILSGMLNYTQIAMLETQKDSTIYQYLEEILTAGNRARDLIAQILLFSRKSSDKLTVINIKSIMEESIRMFKTRLYNSGIKLETNFIDVGFVQATPTYIQQIILNLCINAEQAIEKNGMIKIELLKQENKTCKIVISDNGKGMTEDIRKQIFDPFFTTKEVGKGTGLGLSSVHGIVEKLSGKIEVFSKLNKGSSFEITLNLVS